MTSINMSERLILTRPMYFEDKTCGYCHNKDPTTSSNSIGFQVENFTPNQYDKLINLGFRRSGTFLYKTNVLRNCCKMYTIRTRRELLSVHKEFKQCVNRFNKKIGNAPNQEKVFDLSNEMRKIIEGNERFQIKNETAEFTEEKYELYVKYQAEIHEDHKTSKKSFKRFLCDTPFMESAKISSDHKTEKYGAIHQCYYLDSKLIAIAVLDVLPSGLSSVYLIYDPGHRDMEIGKLSALLELVYCNDYLGLDHYYMGFIIESCQKMVYKKKFGCEVLDLRDYSWSNYEERCREFKDNNELLFDDEWLKEMESSNEEYCKKWNFKGVNFNGQLDKIFDEQGKLLKKVESEDEDEEEDTMYDIPLNIPGLKPLKSAFEMDFDSLELLNFSTMMGRLRYFQFSMENERTKKALITLYRILGQALLEEAVIII